MTGIRMSGDVLPLHPTLASAHPGSGLPGEEEGILVPVKSVGPVEQANISFGQGIAVTPLQ